MPGETASFTINLLYSSSTSLPSSSFDADSIIYFMRQYSAEKVQLVGDFPDGFDSILSSELSSSGQGLDLVDFSDYLSFWHSYDDVVFVEDNYQLALLASTYASLINAPLAIQGYEPNNLDLSNKNVICVGNVPAVNCQEQYNLE